MISKACFWPTIVYDNMYDRLTYVAVRWVGIERGAVGRLPLRSLRPIATLPGHERGLLTNVPGMW